MAEFYIRNDRRLYMEIEQADLKYGGWFSNWSGRTDGEFHYNGIDPDTREGYKYFTIKLPEKVLNKEDGVTYTCDDLIAMGIPIDKYDKNEKYDPEYTMKVRVSYKFKTPIIEVDAGGDIDTLDYNTCKRLDTLMINNPDVVISFGKKNEDSGRRPAYLDEFYCKACVSRMSMKHRRPAENDIDEDPFE